MNIARTSSKTFPRELSVNILNWAVTVWRAADFITNFESEGHAY